MATSTTGTGSWIRRLRPAAAGAVRLVCFPHAGGSASYFQPLAAALSPGVEVLGVQYPGRQDRRHEAPITVMTDLVDQVSCALDGYTGRPLAFFGHSLGAVLAYEVALRLEAARGTFLMRLYASGRRAPSRYRDDDLLHEGDEHGILAELRLLSGTDASIISDPEVVDMIMPALRSDYAVIGTYQHAPGRRVSCALTALTGDRDPRTTVAEARAWSDHTTGPFELHTFPGGHFFIAECAPAVTALLAADLVRPPT